MNFDSGTAYAESDADDEYERSLGPNSPVANSESPIDSELPSSNEHTPTTYAHRSSADRLPETIISEWTADECADFISTIGLPQYADRFVENEIVGEALVALQHDDLKSMGIASVGHRLTILKSVYDVKKAQDIPIESDHYVPLSADAEAQYATATLKDIKHLVEQLRLRDERMSMVEQDLRRLTDDFRRLREDMLPALRLAKDSSQALPLPSGSGNGNNQGNYPYETVSPPAPTPSSTQSMSLKRQYSTKRIMLGTTPKNTSPSHLQTTHERMEQSLDPSNAAERAVLSSSHLAAMNGSATATSPGYPSPNMPSPTSPPTLGGATLGSRSYRSDMPTPSSRSTFAENDHGYKGREQPVAPRRGPTPAPDTPSTSNASVEIFKSFRVSMDDPCYKVLPAALKKYQINAPWDQYALYIVYGDQERCLGLDEKPLILFKQLDKEGKKPMFMLRKTNNAQVDQEQPGSAGLSARGAATGYDPPGGII
ncbi:protein kinase regulator ste50 [Colletotrichum musicola]|uniref:Protein kinase regulator ste50 n=3 Tax=Colletotrichum orchidearum species complex TaxID=2707337 RepID=A0A8H6N8T2_9PEZI|nr:protein kinase regulator ste50 [Colletotrichum sojae]KAF6824464.1 protein kinase regulator ste50 [Colletotrichum musicola]KAF6838190.1 protein kinase regulator ste50 [Colletotrichum plurivorum]